MPPFDLSGAIDLHIHTAPDLRPRKMDGLALARAAAACGMRALMVKSHYGPTWEGAYYITQAVPELCVFGSITLNVHVGGFNPAAVEAALNLGAREVWMPTISSANEWRRNGQPGGLSPLCDGKVLDDVQEILRLIAQADAILGTGHLSIAETQALLPAARAAGLCHILVTHPEHPLIAMPVAVQQELAKRGAWFERCYISVAQFGVPIEQVAGEIRAVGIESTLLATDFGQPEHATPPQGLAEFASRLQALGFSLADLDRMVRRNPAAVLGLDG